jgi:hypothetical protein
MHWCTLRATVRRHGVFTNAKGPKNFNADLCAPMLANIGNGWERVFAQPGALFRGFEANILAAVDRLDEQMSKTFESLSGQSSIIKAQVRDALSNQMDQFFQQALAWIAEAQKCAVFRSVG